MKHLPRKAIASTPELTNRAPFPVVIDQDRGDTPDIEAIYAPIGLRFSGSKSFDIMVEGKSEPRDTPLSV
jgi:hypothetical protein